MSLTVPNAYDDVSRLGNVQENWIVQMGYDDEGANDFLALSTHDTTVSSVFYRGIITKEGETRDQLDLAKSKASSGNCKLTLANAPYQGSDISKILLGGTNKYINRTVKIYSQLNNESTLANCMQIYNGRLVDVSHDIHEITLLLVDHRPWDFISIPQTKGSMGVYVPVAYGNFTENPARTYSSGGWISDAKAYRPVNFIRNAAKKYNYYVDELSTSEAVTPAIYDKNIDKLIPLTTGDTTASVSGGRSLNVVNNYRRGGGTRATKAPVGMTDSDDAIDDNDGSSASKLLTVTDNTNQTVDLDFEIPTPVGDVVYVDSGETGTESLTSTETVYTVTDGTAFSTDDYIKVDDEIMKITSISTNDLTLTRGQQDTANVEHGTGANIYIVSNVLIKHLVSITMNDKGNDSRWETTLSWAFDDGSFTELLRIEEPTGGTTDSSSANIDIQTTDKIEKVTYRFYAKSFYGNGTIQVTFKIYYIGIIFDSRYDKHKDFPVYVGLDGLTKDGWEANGAITEIHEAHRDMLIRYAGYTTDTPYNWWSGLNINSIKDWKIRWWALEPQPLKKILEKLQYEGGFIFKWRADGTGSYWCVKDSYTSADVVADLDENDVSDISVTHTPFSELLTKMEISYEKHPAENRYISSSTHEDAGSPSVRDNWNIQTKENIKQIKLDALVSNVGSEALDQPPSNGFADYYNNIFGDVKLIISGKIKHPKYYKLEAGDIIQLTNYSPITPFNYSWADKYFMITTLQRSVGVMTFKAREVYSA